VVPAGVAWRGAAIDPAVGCRGSASSPSQAEQGGCRATPPPQRGTLKASACGPIQVHAVQPDDLRHRRLAAGAGVAHWGRRHSPPTPVATGEHQSCLPAAHPGHAR